jgi:PAS domain S-box-containing protein
MNHRKRLENSNKSIYILVMSAGVLMAITVLFSLIVGLRINFLYSTLVNSSIQIKLNITDARREFLKNVAKPNKIDVQNAWTNLEQARFNSNLLLEEKDKLNILSLPINDTILRNDVQELQLMLIKYSNLSDKIISGEKEKFDKSAQEEWETQFGLIDTQTQKIQDELNRLLESQIKIFRIVQFFLIGITLVLSFLSVFIFYRYEKQRTIFIRRLNEANSTIESRTNKTTKTEEALQETQRRLSTLVQNLPGMAYRCKLDSQYTMEYVSDMCFNITGYKSDELLYNKSKTYTDIISREDFEKTRRQIQRAIEERKPFQLVYRITTATGFEKWVWEQGVGIYSEKEDEPIALEGFITDITEQKSIQDQLSLQSNALEATANGILITDKDGKILWANNAFSVLTGYSLKEVAGEKPSILKSGEHDESFYAHMWSVILAGNTWRGEIINQKKNGEKYFEEMTITPVKNETGEIINFVSIKQDISERKKSENDMRESEMRFRGLYENSTIGIYRTSIDGNILMANPTLIKILGYDSFDDISKVESKDTYLLPETRNTFVQQLLLTGRINGFESMWKKKDGSIIYIRESARLVRDENERPIYLEGSIEDITEKKKAEEELIISKEKAEQSDRLKSDFLAQMSHEIRTPLNVIINFTDLLKEEMEGKIDAEIKEGFGVVDVEGRRIMRTIDLIINMSQLQTGQYDYKEKTINLKEDILNNLCKDFSTIAESKNLQFNFIQNAESSNINIDEYSVRQIFYHLLDNAIKYTPKGKIEVTLGRDQRGRLYTDVIDTGIGMSDEYQQILFTPFTREETGYTKNSEGNGLGLALAKRYCELNRATLKVKSIKGKGTAFRVTFLDHSNIN